LIGVNHLPPVHANNLAMEPHLLAYAERQAPRYTSYPSAPHFGPEVNATVYRDWLGRLPDDAALSIYMHVPYCKQICWYCGCNTNAAHAGDTGDFVDTALRGIELVAGAANAHRVTEIHWGGGTPNILSTEEFTRLFHHLEFWFDLDTRLAHSIEIDPRHLTASLAETYARAGVNRASLGVQDLNPRVQAAIGRIQPFEQVQQATAELHRAGITQLSFDLMYGLPGQSIDDLLHSVQLSASLQPDRIALFGYAHVPWFKRRQRVINADTLPGSEARFAQAQAAHDALVALGYVAIGLDHFAKPNDPLARAAREGALRRNFQGYVANIPDAILGFGPSAISTLPQGYAQNATGIGAWRRAIDADDLPIVRGHAHSDDDHRRAALIERIMCDFEADLTAFGGREAFSTELHVLAPLIADGIVTIHGNQLTVPEPMHPFCRLVAHAFDTYAAADAARYSRAI
jgi:oxygen-independent coproporphyrinogen-3 oxidase